MLTSHLRFIHFFRDELTGHVDHNVLRHLNIEKDSDQYRKFEFPNPSGLAEKLQKNIENIQNVPINHEALPMPTLEEKANIRERMFDFMDESRMEETRLVRNNSLGLTCDCFCLSRHKSLHFYRN